MKRRSFLQLLGLAPVVAPLVTLPDELPSPADDGWDTYEWETFDRVAGYDELNLDASNVLEQSDFWAHDPILDRWFQPGIVRIFMDDDGTPA